MKQYNILGGVDEMDEEGNVKRVNCNPPLFRIIINKHELKQQKEIILYLNCNQKRSNVIFTKTSNIG